VTFIPKRRRRALFKELRRHFGEVFRALAQKECRIEEGHGICWRTMCTC
jgi:putative transposase